MIPHSQVNQAKTPASPGAPRDPHAPVQGVNDVDLLAGSQAPFRCRCPDKSWKSNASPCGRFYRPLRRFEVVIFPERLKGRFTGVLERSPGGLARAAVAQPDTNLESEIHPKMRRAGAPLWKPPPPSGNPKRRRSREMFEVMTVQEAIEKVREAVCFPDTNPFREYWRKDHRYSLITRLFHALYSENVHPYSLPDAWGRMMKANRAHLVIMLREAGAGHDPFGNAEWSSTPAQVWENLARVEQLPILDGADLSGVDFKWADLGFAKLPNADLTGADLR